MLNKILSKKIKSSLSLRGPFPFCHSREGGNPSPQSLRSYRSNHSGFSLIELMVAVVILAMAIFGIFHAYSTGFMGMADARAVTVATNYAREAMEDIKNMDFDKIPASESSSVTVNGIKYIRQVIVQENPNIKRVVTTVTWEDRNGKQKMVETDMVVHFIETTAGNPTRIMLYADPYSVLVLDSVDYHINKYKYISTITAVIKDAIGNTVTTWNEDIAFLLTGSGTISSDTVTTDNFENGKAIITFTSDTDEGEVTITASTEGLASDSVTINVYNPGVPVKINFTENAESAIQINIISMLPGGSTLLTATIVDAGGNRVNDATNEINFSRTGPGTLSTPTTTVDGIATINLASNGDPGTITVTAEADGLVPGVVVVLTGGHIALEASPIEVPNGEESVITVTIEDVNGLPINYDGVINLDRVGSGGGSGEFPDSVSFDGLTSSIEFTFTATSEGVVEIEAENAGAAIFTSDILTLTVIEELTPHHIIVYATPLSIPAGGAKTLITAKVMTEGNVKITSYDEPIEFMTNLGTFSNTGESITLYNSNENYNDGVATVELYSSDNAETATITVCSPSNDICKISGETTVGFFTGPDHIKLSAVPPKIPVNGSPCTVTAEIVDYVGTLISSYNGDIHFSISPCPYTINFLEATTSFLTQKIKKGITTVTLISGTTAGTAVLYAFSGNLSGSLNIPVGITLSLVNNEVSPSYDSTGKIVSFDIDVQGANLILEEMQISWGNSSDETLDKIEIKSPNDATDSNIAYAFDYYDTNIPGYPASSGDLVNIKDDIILLENYSKIILYFNNDFLIAEGGKTFNIIFNPNSGNYLVEFTIPSPTP